MENLKGNWGRLLYVNLDTKETNIRNVPEKLFRKYIGGSGLAAKIIFDETDQDTEALSRENVLVFMAGPITGTSAPLSGRHAVAAISPLMGIWGEADSGGTWGHKLKKAGWDGVVIKGASDKPVYIKIENDEVEIRSAEALWGMDTFETDKALINELRDEDYTVSCIGPAGENLVRFACVNNDGKHARVAGRTGLGAVMGFKKLKAIAVKGDKKVPVHDDAKLKEKTRIVAKKVIAKTAMYQEFGTSGQVVQVEEIGDLPIKNWKQGSWKEGAARVNGVKMADTILTGRYGCRNCVVRCGREVQIKEGPYASEECAGVEYETIGALGSNILIDDLNTVQHLNEMCNRYGMDTIAAGSVIAFAIEASENGLLDEYSEYGLDWSKPELAIRLLKEIAYQEGLGKLLALGTIGASKKIGGGSEDYAVHCKGLDFPSHDPRALVSLGLGYATSNRGACHVANLSHIVEKGITIPELGFPEQLDRFSSERKGVLVARMQNLMALFDAMKLCKFTIIGASVTDIMELFNAVTGYDMDLEEFLNAGERIYTIKRLFNYRKGIDRSKDILPKRALEPKTEGGAKGSVPQLEIMLDEYYEEKGWSNNGIPLEESLIRLDLQKEGRVVGIV